MGGLAPLCFGMFTLRRVAELGGPGGLECKSDFSLRALQGSESSDSDFRHTSQIPELSVRLFLIQYLN